MGKVGLVEVGDGGGGGGGGGGSGDEGSGGEGGGGGSGDEGSGGEGGGGGGLSVNSSDSPSPLVWSRTAIVECRVSSSQRSASGSSPACRVKLTVFFLPLRGRPGVEDDP